MLSESLTRISIAYDLLLTGSLVGTDLTLEDQLDITTILDLARDLLARHEKDPAGDPLELSS